MKRNFLVGLATVLVILFAWLVWPTRYQYEHTGFGESQQCLVRIDRITGKTEILVDLRWVPLFPPSH
jgi:hypothetical protein